MNESTGNVLTSFDNSISEMLNIMSQSTTTSTIMKKNAEIDHLKSIGKLHKLKNENSEEMNLINKLDPELWEDTINIIDSINNNIIPKWRNQKIDWWTNILFDEVNLLKFLSIKKIDDLNELDKEFLKTKITELLHNILSISILNNKTDIFYTTLLTGETTKDKIKQSLSDQKNILEYKLKKELILMSSLEILDILIIKFVELWFLLDFNIDDLLKNIRIISAIKYMNKKYNKSWKLSKETFFKYVEETLDTKIDINSYTKLLKNLESRIAI